MLYHSAFRLSVCLAYNSIKSGAYKTLFKKIRKNFPKAIDKKAVVKYNVVWLVNTNRFLKGSS